MRLNTAVTTALDVMGLLLLAGGVGAGLQPLIGWWSLVAAGMVIIVGSAVGALRDRAAGHDDADAA